MNFGRIYKDINPIFASEDFRKVIISNGVGIILAQGNTSQKTNWLNQELKSIMQNTKSKRYKYLNIIFFALNILLISGIKPGIAQSWKSKPFSIAAINNATLPFPRSVVATFNEPLHPGIALGYEFGWFETIKSPMFRNINTYALGGKKVSTGKWFQNIGLAYYHHKNLNHAFTLTTQGGYRRYFGKFSAEAGIHAGYLHALPETERSVQQSDGTWKPNSGIGRSYLITGAGVGVGYDAGYHHNMRRIFLNYDYRIQLPFSSGYVKVLPNGLLSLGVQFTLFKNSSPLGKPKQERLECPE